MAPPAADSRPPRLLDQLRQQIRYLHYSLRTERTVDMRHGAAVARGPQPGRRVEDPAGTYAVEVS